MKGRLVAAGETAEVFAPPLHPYTELLLSSVPEMDPEWLDHVLVRRKAVAEAAKVATRALVG